jgi:ABC-2 type transport system permease protein
MVYLKSGYSEKEAIDLSNKNMTKLSKTKATVKDTSDGNHRSYYTGMFTFNGYTLLMMLCISVSAVLNFTKDTDIKNRINVSGMPFANRNAATILAVISIGLIITTAVNITVAIMGSSDYNAKLPFYCLNSYVLMFVGLGMAFLLSAITTNDNIINMITNMFVLSMSFFCGVFIDTIFLSKDIVAAAHFMPLYWYTAAVKHINDTATNRMFTANFIEYLLLEALFALLFFGAGLVISKKKEQYAI